MDGCPWCGEELPPDVVKPSDYDQWLEAHSAECAPFLAEQPQAEPG